MASKMLFKITHNLFALDFCSFFGLTNYTSTTGHNYKLGKPICNKMPASFRSLVDELTHEQSIYIPVNGTNALSLSGFTNLPESCYFNR